jgi:hypothetical protein
VAVAFGVKPVAVIEGCLLGKQPFLHQLAALDFKLIDSTLKPHDSELEESISYRHNGHEGKEWNEW